MARGVLGLVVGLAGIISGLGVLLAPWLARLIAPGFGPDQAALTTQLLRILFPMAGFMILAAWCLGVLNSHRRFFLPFVAPVLWNLAQIGGLILGSGLGLEPLIVVLAWSTLIGSLLQLLVQTSSAWRLAGSLRPWFTTAWEPVRRVARNALPVIAGQGILQVSSIVDIMLASLLTGGTIPGLYFAQRVAQLPHGLFGVAVATAALPEMSREGSREALRQHVVNGLFRIVFFVLPSAVVLILFADLIVTVLFERGEFNQQGTELVSLLLRAYALGIVATSSVKLFASAFHARQDTRTPMKIAAIAIAVGVSLGAALMFWLASEGRGSGAAVGLALGGVAGAWLNVALLWRALGRRLGRLVGPRELRGLGRLLVASGVAGVAGWIARSWLEGVIAPEGLTGLVLLLAGTLVAAGVPYLLIARRPPTAEPDAAAVT